MILKFQVYICTVLVLFNLFGSSNGVSLDKDLTISYDQKLVLDKFKDLVLRRLPHDYMKKDIYLIRWLRARNFNIRQAEIMLLDNLKWRNDYSMDTIHEEDWLDFNNNYKYSVDGRDKVGRPIVFMSFGAWDVRKAIVSGQREKLIRFLNKDLDLVNLLVRQFQDQGDNVTQAVVVINLDGYNVIQQGCLQCVPLYINFVTVYEEHYSGLAHKIILLNTPGVFQVILNAVRPFMTQETREALKVYGTNRREWEDIIYKEINRDQLPEEIRGTKLYDD